MRYAKILTNDYNNGEGVAVSIFVTGCERHCKGCHNSELWDKNVGSRFDEVAKELIINSLMDKRVEKHLSILGGEPLNCYNYPEVLQLCKDVKERTGKTIWLWTGNELQEVISKYSHILEYVDFIKCGEYIEDLNEGNLNPKYTGSTNQKVYTVKDILERLRMEKVFMNKEDISIKKVEPKRFFEPVPKDKKKCKDDPILMPKRATKGSAGYDFYTPIDFDLKPGEKKLIFTNVRAFMQPGEVLLLDTTSGNGTKKGVVLANTLGVVDSDYYYADNGGNIGICVLNTNKSFEITGFETIEGQRIIYSTDPNKDNYIKSKKVRVPIVEDLTEENTIHFKAGDKIAQGFFVNYLSSDNCNGDAVRTGGFGSTDKTCREIIKERYTESSTVQTYIDILTGNEVQAIRWLVSNFREVDEFLNGTKHETLPSIHTVTIEGKEDTQVADKIGDFIVKENDGYFYVYDRCSFYENFTIKEEK